MATGGYDRAVDSRVTCSICLEPYKGRHPKLLQCFHTFCSPCLTQLADRETPRSNQPADGDPEDTKLPASIICPTCRTPTPLPPGGVPSLQTNFYLDDGDDQGDLRPLLCDLCEEGQEAKFTCSKCLACFCIRCRRFHDKLCKSSQVSELKVRPGAEDRRQVTQESHQQVQLLEDVLKKLGQEEKRLTEERRAREHDIHVRYATLLRHATEVRDASLVSLREVTQVLNDAMQADVTLARDILNKLKEKTPGQKARDEPTDPSCEVLTDLNRCHFEELLQKKEDETLLIYNPSDTSTESVLRSHREFMGTVRAAEQDSGETLNTDSGKDSGKTKTTDQAHPAVDSDSQVQSADGLSLERPPVTPGTHGGMWDLDLQELASRLDHLTAKHELTEKLVSTLQNQNALLCRDLASFHDKNTKQCSDITSLKSELTSVKDEGRKVRDDLTSLRRDHVSARGKHSILCQEKQRLGSDLDTIQKNQDKVQTDVQILQANQTKLQTDVNTLQMDQTKLQTDVNTLQTDQTKLQTDVNTLQMDQTKLQTDVDTLQMDQTKLQTDVNTFQSDNSQQKIDQTKLCTDIWSVNKQVEGVIQKHSKLGSDMTSLQDLLKKDSTTVAVMESKMRKLSVQVAFHALLDNTVMLTEEQTLICDKVISSVGGGYNSQTGVFTAPASGTYCFMVTSSPLSDDNDVWCDLVIVMEDEVIGYLGANGKGSCTGHAAVQVQAGHKVWLRSFATDDHPVNTYYGESATTFTGMLLQPEL